MTEKEIVWTGVSTATFIQATTNREFSELNGAMMWLPLHVQPGIFHIRFKLYQERPERGQLRIFLRPTGCLPRQIALGKPGEQTIYATAALSSGDAVSGEWASISGNLITTKGFHLRVERGLLDAIAEAAQ